MTRFFPIWILFLLGLSFQLLIQSANAQGIDMPSAPDLKIKNLEWTGSELVVSFQNLGRVDLGKTYQIEVKLGGRVLKSQPLKMLGTNDIQEYIFTVDRGVPQGSQFVIATIDSNKSISESDENNDFLKRMNF